MSIPRITKILEDQVGIDGQNFETEQVRVITELEVLGMILLELKKLNLSMQIAFDIDLDEGEELGDEE